MKDLKTTNILLLILVIPVVFYILKTMSFLFIPLVFSMFIALLFLPLMRWLGKFKVPKFVSIIIVILLIIGGLKIGVELIQLSSKQIMASESDFFSKAEVKLDAAKFYLEDNLIYLPYKLLIRFVYKYYNFFFAFLREDILSQSQLSIEFIEGGGNI